MAEKSVKRLYDFSGGLNKLFYSDELDENQLTEARNVNVDGKGALKVSGDLTYWKGEDNNFENNASDNLNCVGGTQYDFFDGNENIKSNVVFLSDGVTPANAFHSEAVYDKFVGASSALSVPTWP